MTETEWLTCLDPEPMLRFLLQNRASARKLRLFAVACVRRCPELFPTDRERNALDVALLLADNRVPAQDLRLARGRVRGEPIAPLLEPAAFAADEAAWAAARVRGRGITSAAFRAENKAQTDLLREVFGCPMRPVTIEPSWLEWNGRLVHDWAQRIYQDRTLFRLPVLADMLEDAGCTNAEVLDHFRGSGPHVLGCHVLDALLGRAGVEETIR